MLKSRIPCLVAWVFLTLPAWGVAFSGSPEIHHINVGQGDASLAPAPKSRQSQQPVDFSSHISLLM